MQVFLSGRCESVGLLLPRRISLLEAFDPGFFKKPSQSSVERARAQTHPAIADLLNILHQAITVERLVYQAKKDQKDRLGQWLGFWLVRS